MLESLSKGYFFPLKPDFKKSQNTFLGYYLQQKKTRTNVRVFLW